MKKQILMLTILVSASLFALSPVKRTVVNSQIPDGIVSVLASVGEGQVIKIDDTEAKVVCYAITGKYTSGGGSGAAISCIPR